MGTGAKARTGEPSPLALGMQAAGAMTSPPHSTAAFLPILLLTGLAWAATSSPARAEETGPWPEAERSFYYDGAGWLLDAGTREKLLTVDAASRAASIGAFLGRDPIPETAGNELQEGIRRRLELARSLFLSPADIRYQILFLNGPPAERLVIDCGEAYKPLEVWSYTVASASGARGVEAQEDSGAEPEDGEVKGRSLRRRSRWSEGPMLVLFRPTPLDPYQLWRPHDGKKVLYTSQMQYLLDQYEELRNLIVGMRFDLQSCKEARKVDRATGVEGLTGFLRGRPTAPAIDAFVAPPEDLATWAREAALTPLPPSDKAALAASALDVQFPNLAGDRMLTRLVVTVPAGDPIVPNADGDLELMVEGVLSSEGRVLAQTRVRFELEPAEAGQPLQLAIDELLRPGQPVAAHFKVWDATSGATAWVAGGFRVPRSPVAEDAVVGYQGAVAQGQKLAEEAASVARDSLMLAPPLEGQVVLGLWRSIALVTGTGIKKVIFKLDGVPQVTRVGAPWDVELRLSTYPREQIVSAEGYDAAGKLLAVDEVILNQPRGAFRVRIVEPRRGAKLAGEVTARAEVVVPDEREVTKVEFKVGDEIVATLEKPPWTAVVRAPATGETAYVSATAYLDDGRQSEDVRFLNAPAYVEEVDVRLVELYTTVADRNGRVEPGLTEADFEVFEDGRRQQISKFELVENLPLILGITIDTSGSMSSALTEAQAAARAFLEEVVRPEDHCFVVAFSGKPTLVMPPTDDESACSLGLEGLQAVGATALHDAVVTSLYYMRELEGQRALVLLSDGDDTSSGIGWNDALEYAKRSGVVIFPVGLDVGAADLRVRGKLGDLARETGGRVFYIDRARELASIYAEIENELRSRYLIAYAPDRSDESGAFRVIEVRVKKDGLKARTLRGYYR